MVGDKTERPSKSFKVTARSEWGSEGGEGEGEERQLDAVRNRIAVSGWAE